MFVMYIVGPSAHLAVSSQQVVIFEGLAVVPKGRQAGLGLEQLPHKLGDHLGGHALNHGHVFTPADPGGGDWVRGKRGGMAKEG